ncbi:hypothetical protein ACS0TY_018233 [Phlomoides rotata]
MRPQKGPQRVDTNVAAHFITDVSGKYPRLWVLKGAHPVTVNMWYKFGALASIRTVAPGIREISELPDWVFNVVYESWHNNPYLKRGYHSMIRIKWRMSQQRLELCRKIKMVAPSTKKKKSHSPSITEKMRGIHDGNHEVAAVGLNCEEQFVKADGYDPVILQSKGMNLVYDAISLRKHVGSDMVVMDYF